MLSKETGQICWATHVSVETANPWATFYATLNCMIQPSHQIKKKTETMNHLIVSLCKIAALWLLCRHWLWFYTENSWWSLTWPDNIVHSNTVRTRTSISRRTSKSESADGSIQQHRRTVGLQRTATSIERTLPHSWWICLRCRCSCRSWPQFVFAVSLVFCFL